MAGYKLIGNNKLIPKVTYTGRHRTITKTDDTSPFKNRGTETTYETFDVEGCVVQPLTGRAAKDFSDQINPGGGKQYDAFTVYSTTPLYGLVEGSDQLSDQIQLTDSRGVLSWFTVIKADSYPSSGVSRYRSYVVAVPAGQDGGI